MLRPTDQRTNQSPSRRQAGFTLFEVVMTSTLLSVILIALTMNYQLFVAQGSAQMTRAQDRHQARAVMAELENAIRLSSEVEKAGESTLLVQNSYLVDQDDEVEEVLYTKDGDQLLRTVTQGGSTGSPEVLMDGVQSFSATYLRIEDGFSATTYESVLPTGGLPSQPDTATIATYELADMDRLDASVIAGYDATIEAVRFTNRAAVALSPRLAGEGLVSQIKFTPVTGIACLPLSHGESAGVNCGGILFAANGAIRVRAYGDSGATSTVTSTSTWVGGDEVQLRLTLIRGEAHGEIHDGTNWVYLGSVAYDTTTVGRVWTQCSDPDAIFDEVLIEKPLIEIELTVVTARSQGELSTEPALSSTLELRGGAVPQN